MEKNERQHLFKARVKSQNKPVRAITSVYPIISDCACSRDSYQFNKKKKKRERLYFKSISMKQKVSIIKRPVSVISNQRQLRAFWEKLV